MYKLSATLLDYGSAGAPPDLLSRVASLKISTEATSLVACDYLAGGIVVQANYPQPSVVKKLFTLLIAGSILMNSCKQESQPHFRIVKPDGKPLVGADVNYNIGSAASEWGTTDALGQHPKKAGNYLDILKGGIKVRIDPASTCPDVLTWPTARTKDPLVKDTTVEFKVTQSNGADVPGLIATLQIGRADTSIAVTDGHTISVKLAPECSVVFTAQEVSITVLFPVELKSPIHLIWPTKN